MGVPQNEWFRMEHPKIKWMILGYPHFRKPPHRYQRVDQTSAGKLRWLQGFETTQLETKLEAVDVVLWWQTGRVFFEVLLVE
jgi:hypothetical protein